ncbi:peptidase domain-containing ABC transporter [Desulfobacter latus]|uniref:ATP-binding cassette domain-containing protein n=1 Tax=Desulfobacter latus TaxID=2292 RepID=A0A850T7W7_9BACT|nr:ATP-binding cassette domain-containing protein [Desulfobacter latus]NWH03456.1 ATP-binding cassette domain-containing protein [Desulfobacter latus]
MIELLKRLFHRPLLALEILAATFLTSLLTLAMPLYVIQILNRYVSYGFNGTLITLTSGMLIAIFLQLGLRMLRTRMAVAVNQVPNHRLAQDMITLVFRAGDQEAETKSRLSQGLNHVDTIHQAYDAHTLTAVLDAPFSLVFIGVIYLLHPVLAAAACMGIALALIFGWLTTRRSAGLASALLTARSEQKRLNLSGINGLETVRAFCAGSFLWQKWVPETKKINRLQNRMSAARELGQSVTMACNSLSSLLIYAVGAVLVVQGNLTVGALIGTNILSARAFQNASKLVQAMFSLSKANRAFKELTALKAFPLELEADDDRQFSPFKGHIAFKDLGFSYRGTNTPVFESLTLTLEPGQVMVVCGKNGSGKSTLARLLMGLEKPGRGAILVDHVNIRQFPPAWWRRQIIYLPQEPVFIEGSIQENITLMNPELSLDQLNALVIRAGLKDFLDKTPAGLATPLSDNEKNFPFGIRKRIALARALAGGGRLVVLDAPTESLDETGKAAIYRLMNDMAKTQRTMVIFTNDPKIIKGATMVLDMDSTPVPEIKYSPMVQGNREIKKVPDHA